MSKEQTAVIRFKLDDERDMQAWQLLQDRNKKEYSSYSKAVVEGLIQLLGESSNTLDWNEIDRHLEEHISKIVEDAVGNAVERMLPFLTGYMTGVGTVGQIRPGSYQALSVADSNESSYMDEDVIDEDIDYDFLGLA